MNNSAVGLVRVSTIGQAEEGCSLEMQEQKVRAYCELNDLSLTEMVTEAGISGRAKKREGLDRVMELIQTGEVHHLVIFKLDRLSRSLKQAIEVVEFLQSNGCELHSICEKIDTSTATGRFFFHITSAISCWEAETIAERTASALQSKKARGERVGQIPYGMSLCNDGIHLEPDPTEQKVIAKVKRYSAKKMSMREIACRLNNNGHTTKDGRAWTHRQIGNILRE